MQSNETKKMVNVCLAVNSRTGEAPLSEVAVKQIPDNEYQTDTKMDNDAAQIRRYSRE